MPNWNRLLVGDAFKVQPGGINYYRDLFLLRPFLGFSIGATFCLIEPKFSAHRIEGLKWAFCAAVVLLLAKEKRILIIVAPTYIFIRMAILIIFVHTREVLLWALVSGVALFALFRSRLIREWKPSYVFPQKIFEFYVLDMVVGMSGLAAMFLVFQWIKP